MSEVRDEIYRQAPNIRLLLVCYKNPSQVAEFAARFADSPGIEIAIADNSPEPAEAKLLEACSDVMAWFPDNPGYLASAVRVSNLADCLEPSDSLGWVVLSNTDLDLDREAITRWLSSHDCRESIVVGPDIRSPLGAPMNPFATSRPSSIALTVRAVAFQFPMTFALARRRFLSRERVLDNATGKSYAVHGSLVAFSGPAWAKLSGEMIDAPLFSEEILIADACDALGIRVQTDLGARVGHSGSATTASLGLRRGQMNSRGLRHVLIRRAGRALPRRRTAVS